MLEKQLLKRIRIGFVLRFLHSTTSQFSCCYSKVCSSDPAAACEEHFFYRLYFILRFRMQTFRRDWGARKPVSWRFLFFLFDRHISQHCAEKESRVLIRFLFSGVFDTRRVVRRLRRSASNTRCELTWNWSLGRWKMEDVSWCLFTVISEAAGSSLLTYVLLNHSEDAQRRE